MRTKIGYMCSTAFGTELHMDTSGTKVYPSIEALRHHQACTQEGLELGCGIVKVEVREVETIQEEAYGANWGKAAKPHRQPTEES